MQQKNTIESSTITDSLVNLGNMSNVTIQYFRGLPITPKQTPRAKPHLFLSYGRGDDDPDFMNPDKSFLRRLYNDLTAQGYTVWWDREKMPSRDLTFLQEIRDAVDDADRVLLIVGPYGMKSDYVRAEWEFARSQCKPVIPLLRLGDYSLIPKELGMYHAPDCRETRPYNDALAEILRVLGDEDKPLAGLYGVPNLPPGYIVRPELADLKNAVRADAVRPIVVTPREQSITLQGVGGIGKTTLTAALARECDVRRSFPDGIFWLEMGKTPSVAERMADIGAIFGDDRQEYRDEKSAKMRLSAVLAHRAALIALDDVWAHPVAQAFMDSLGGRCRIVITTRQTAIAGKLGAAQQTLDQLTEDEGVALVYTRLGIPHPLAPSPKNGEGAYEADIRAIIRLVHGHTLAVALAAAWLQEKDGIASAPDLLNRLRKGRTFEDLQLDDSDKNLNLELCLWLSYDDLGGQDAEKRADLQRRYRALGVFAPESSFDAAAAQAVWQDDDEFTAPDKLAELARAGLLLREPGGRYRQHPLLRAYARALLAREGETAEAEARHFAYYFQQHGDFNTNNNEDRHAQITADFANIQQAWQVGLTALPEQTCDFIIALDYYMQFHSTILSRKDWVQQAYQAAEDANYVSGLANTLKALGDVALRENEYGAARGYYERALPVYEQIGARVGLANTLKALGDVALRENEYAAARGYFDKAQALYNTIGDYVGRMNILISLARMMRQQGDIEAAKTYFETLFQMTDGHPSFAHHPMTQQLKREYQQLIGGAPS